MKRAVVLIVALAAGLAACGDDSETGSDGANADATSVAGRTVEVSMTEMAFSPATLDVAVGETVTFVFRNDGVVRHEAVFGNEAEQQAHHVEMAEMGGHDDMAADSMAHGAEEMSDLHSVIVEPGESVEMSHTFDVAGATMIGCHEPGHWEAGMKLDVEVS